MSRHQFNEGTPTPRTESFIDKQLTEWPLWDWQDHASAYADFARTLERELVEANEACRKASVDALVMRDDLLKELAALRRDRERLYEALRGLLDNSAVITPPDGDPCYVDLQIVAEHYDAAYAAIDAAQAQEDKT